MKLHDLAWGGWTRRVTIYLKEKGITDLEIVAHQYGDEKSSEMIKINPLGFLPALELDDGTVLVDSIAIMYYLEELYPNPSFIGQSPEQRCRMNAFLNLANEFFIKSLPVFANRIPQFSRALKQSEQVAAWLEPFYNRTIAGMEMLVDDNGPFLMGERLTLADCAVYPLYHHNLENYDIETFGPSYPKLQRWAEMFYQRDSAACPLRDDGLREVDDPPAHPSGKKYWWQTEEEKVS